MIEIDDTIGHVGRLYRAITGREIPTSDAAYASIPAEKDPVQHVQEQVDRLLQLLGNADTTPGAPARTAAWMPPLSIWESDTEVVACVDLPGVSREHLEVNVRENVLTIAGQRLPAANGHRPRMSELALGSFRRTMMLPAGLRVSELSAHLKDGVLEIRIPRETALTGEPRAIPVS